MADAAQEVSEGAGAGTRPKPDADAVPDSPEARGQGSGKARQGKADENWTIPKANIKRIVSAKLAEVQGEKKFQVSKEALLAFGEVTMTFISYVMAVANEVLKSKGKRQTVQPEEVLDAIDMIEMGEFRAELESSLASFNEQKAEKADAAKKRKAAAQARSPSKHTRAETGEGAGEDAEDEGDEEGGGDEEEGKGGADDEGADD